MITISKTRKIKTQTCPKHLYYYIKLHIPKPSSLVQYLHLYASKTPKINILVRINLENDQINDDSHHIHPNKKQTKLNIDKRSSSHQRLFSLTPHHKARTILPIHKTTQKHQPRRPQHKPHDHQPHPLEKYTHRLHIRHRQAPVVSSPRQHSRGQRSRDDGLKEEVVLPLHPHVVGGVEVEHEQLHRQRHRGHGVAEPACRRGRGLGWFFFEEECGEGVGEEGEGDDGVLEAVEVGGGDGAVGGEGVVAAEADEEVHENGGGGGGHDEVELQEFDWGGGEPCGGGVGGGIQSVEFGVVDEVPYADEGEAGAVHHMPSKISHWFLLERHRVCEGFSFIFENVLVNSISILIKQALFIPIYGNMEYKLN